MMALYIALAAVILMLGAVLLWAKGAQRQQAQRSALKMSKAKPSISMNS